jgi:chemotaxis protein CheY-P-specific phosphatase CheC
VSGAAQHVLSTLLGDDVSFTVDSEVPGSVTRSFTSFSGALAEIHNARVFGGIHFRTACKLGSKLGADVADWVMAHAMN